MRKAGDIHYGVVKVLRGRHLGRLGYYDDDSDDGHRAIVYFGTPLGPDNVLIWKRWLRQATAAEERSWSTQHLNELAYYRAMRKAFAPRTSMR